MHTWIEADASQEYHWGISAEARLNMLANAIQTDFWGWLRPRVNIKYTPRILISPGLTSDLDVEVLVRKLQPMLVSGMNKVVLV